MNTAAKKKISYGFATTDAKDSLIYWKDKLTGLATLNLPVDFRIQNAASEKRVWVSQKLNADVSAKVKALSEREGVTSFTTLLSACKLLLKNYCDEDDVCISTLSFSNNAGSSSSLVDVLPIRTLIKDDLSFTGLMHLVKQNFNEAYEHSSISVSDTLGDEGIVNRENIDAVFQVVFITENSAHNNIIDFYHNALIRNNILPQLSFLIKENSRQIEISLEYSKDIFNPQTVSRITEHYEQLLLSVTTEPDKSLSDVDILTAFEKQLLLSEFNNTKADYPKDKTLINLFEEQVNLHGNDTALIFKNSKCTFNDLNTKANQLADYLRTHYAVGEEDLVAVKLQRSEWMIISILAVLKAGAAYVPVDPSLNQARIDYIVEDSNCKIIINDKEIEKFKGISRKFSSRNFPQVNNAKSLAYVIYTSGSTGQPKGVMIEHQGAVNRIEWMWRKYHYTSADVILQKTTNTFDVSVWEIFMPLCRGCKMVLCEKDDIASPHRIASLVKTQKVTCLHFVPGMFNAFLTALADEHDFSYKLNSLRLVITSGEALLPETVKKWYSKINVPVHNLYGPTEASVDVTYYNTSRHDTKIPIGKPIWNTQIYILNKHRRLVPFGVIGEICIAGDGLARGYINKPALTSEKFIENPFMAGKKMYKTGDYGRWLNNGDIEYLGRKDDQVKIRGFRVELGEIENAIVQWKQVSEAAVLAISDEEGDKSLVAYVVAGQPINNIALQNYLRTALPEYMVPSIYNIIDKLPLNSNGKVDKKLLAALQLEKNTISSVITEPETKTENIITDIWKDVLKLKSVSTHDNFFDIGGHSLTAIRVMTAIEKDLNIRLPLAILFENPTIQQLAKRIDNSQLNEWECLVPIRPSGSKPPVYIVHGAGGHILIFNYLLAYLHPEQPVYGLQPKGIGEKSTIPQTVEELASAYVLEILQQNPEGPFALAGFSFGGVIAFEMAQQLKALGKEVKIVAMFDSYLGEKYIDAPFLIKKWKRISFESSKRINTLTSLARNNRFIKIQFELNILKQKAIKLYHKCLWLFRRKGSKKSHMYYIYKVREQFDKSWLEYIPKIYEGDIVLFKATKRTYYYHDYEYLGWKPFVKGNIIVHKIQSEHNLMFRPPHNKIISKQLQTILNNAFN